MSTTMTGGGAMTGTAGEATAGSAGGTILDQALDALMRNNLGLRAGENFVVVADQSSSALADAMWRAARRCAAEAVVVLIDDEGDLAIPAPAEAALVACDVYLAPTGRRSLSHSPARVKATEAGARGATLPGVTVEMVERLALADAGLLRTRSETLARLFDEADHAQVSCPRGTDLMVDIRGRRGGADIGDLTAPHAFGNLPSGEAFVSPRMGSGQVAVTSVTPHGLLAKPMLLSVDGGRLAGATGEHAEDFLQALDEHGPTARNLAELGAGTNEKAMLTGNVLEDEKVLGTVHVAFGASDAMGGEVAASVHRDVVIAEPTLEIGGVRVIERGTWLL